MLLNYNRPFFTITLTHKNSYNSEWYVWPDSPLILECCLAIIKECDATQINSRNSVLVDHQRYVICNWLPIPRLLSISLVSAFLFVSSTGGIRRIAAPSIATLPSNSVFQNQNSDYHMNWFRSACGQEAAFGLWRAYDNFITADYWFLSMVINLVSFINWLSIFRYKPQSSFRQSLTTS